MSVQERAPKAIVYCQGAFGTTIGKTAHGLVRLSRRYRIVGVIDEDHAGEDAGEVLDGRPAEIPIIADLSTALAHAQEAGIQLSHFIFGVAPDGGRLDMRHRESIVQALEAGLHVVSGLHDILGEDSELQAIAERTGASLFDVRKTQDRHSLHFFTGKIEEVGSYRVAMLGTDSAVGKRTTAWLLVDALAAIGISSDLVGTGQTAWMQGVRHGIILDSLVNDFVAGEIEHAVWSAWRDGHPKVLVLEGQGSMLHPAYPGGFELLAAGRPDVVVVQHAPARKEYDGFPDWPLHPLKRQIQAIELVSDRPVIAVTINREGLTNGEVIEACNGISRETGLPVFDPLADRGAGLADLIHSHLASEKGSG